MKQLLKLTGCVALAGLMSSCGSVQEKANYQIIPLPQEIVTSQVNPFILKSGVKILYPEGNEKMQRNAQFLADYLKTATGKDFSIEAGTEGKNAIVLALGSEVENPESYQLKVTDQGVTITAPTEAGVFYGIQTLRKSLPIALGADVALPAVEIKDAPRFGYRGAHFDVSRHFFTIDEVKTYIDMLALHNMNRLHWHITDDQGWRLEIKKYPKLTEIGSQRSGTVIGRNSGEYDNTPYGGFYTQEQAKEIVDYAAERYITVVPEIDLPGHCLALLAALPQLSCKGGKFEAYPEELDGQKRKRADENMLCIGNPETYRFVEKLVAELTDLFPSSFIHLGGDEVSTHLWEQCPKCQKIYKQENMTSWHELQDYFTKRVSEIVRSKGKRMIGWDEINDRNAADISDVIMIWQRDGREQQQKALKRGLSVIMSPKDPCYFDFGYSRNSTRRLYEWEPVGKECTNTQAHLVKGGQANLWTEFITTSDEVERMLYPRTCALAETLWNTKEKKEWEGFRQRISKFGAIMEKLNICYFKDEDWDNTGFVPQSEQRPRLVCPARIDTNMKGIKYYMPEYAFDGDIQTFFATPYSLKKGDYFTLTLEKRQAVQEIRIVFDVSKEHPEHVQLSVSEDGTIFKKVAADNKNGELSASFSTLAMIKALKMELTTPLMARLTIKEIILRYYE